MERMEDTLIRWMQRAVAEQENFVVQLNNYSGFPGRAIFLRVQNPDPFRELAQAAEGNCRLTLKNTIVRHPSSSIHPHMSYCQEPFT